MVKRTERPKLPRLAEVLTSRQLQVVDLIAAAYDNGQIASRLGVTVDTIKNHITAILAESGLCSRYELILAALEQGRVDLAARVEEIASERNGCAERNEYEW